jgi:hypothetical protein
MAKKGPRSAHSSVRPPVESIEQFDAAYLPPEARGNRSPAQEEQIGIGLVSHVLRDFRRNLRS